VRIVGGQWRGHPLKAPKGRDTRPTADRVREAIFSAVYSQMGDLEGLVVIDLFAGSGALGLEALSRGAARCVFVDPGRDAASSIRANAEALDASPESTLVVQVTASRFASRPAGERRASLLLMDPPYRIDASEVCQLLEGLAARGFLEHGALVVYEHSSDTTAVWPAGFVGGSVRRYGSTAVSFANYEGEDHA